MRQAARARAGRARARAAVIAVVTAIAAAARADDGAPDEPARREAAALFAEGERAFGAGDFAHAAASFEAAFRAAPHPDALWNAARAYHRAGERARAANLYARYLREAPPAARDRDAAAAALRDLAERLGRVDLVAPGGTALSVDGEPAPAASVYVHPGTHVVSARIGDRVVERAPSVDAGAVVSVALVADPPPLAPAPATPVEPAPPRAAAPAAIAPPPPRPALVVAIAAGGLTIVSGALLTWSGVDTLDARASYDTLPAGTRTQGVIDAGRAKQDRTNVLVGVTAGLAAVTAASVVWLFATEPRASTGGVRVGIAGAGAAVAGRF